MFHEPTAIVVASRQRALRQEADRERLARLARRSRQPAERPTPAIRTFVVRLGRLVAAAR
jgi:hypothetical protein